MSTTYGRQPGYFVLLDQRRYITRTASEIGVPEAHLSRALRGVIRPNLIVRQRLPKLLGRPLRELFTPDAIALPPCAGRGSKAVAR